MAEMSWKDAAKKVLEDAGKPLHYSDITDRILGQGLKTTAGATPAATVNAIISTAIQKDQKEGSAGVFERTGSGEYGLKTGGESEALSDDDAESGSLEAFGVYWERGRVNWAGKPRLFGRAHPKADRVDLAGQQGVYLLYDENRVVVYVGQAAKQSIGQRLAQHTSDRLTGRWQRFSWFGIRPVAEDGKLGSVKAVTITPKQLISTLEALLIEALEPRQNRAGSSYSGAEYIQVTDPKL